MDILNQYHEAVAVLTARTVLGLLFFFQGYDAVFRIGMGNVIAAYRANFENKRIPQFLIAIASWFTAYTELIGGALLILGLFKFAALYLLGANMIIAVLGFGLNTPMWDTKHVMPRMVLLLFLLAVSPSWDLWSLDNLIIKS